MAYDFKRLKEGASSIEDRLKNDFSAIRTGRAVISVLDKVEVEAYGAKMGVNQVAAINLEDAKTVRIVPWDMGQAKAIEKAIASSNLGVSVTLDEKGLRVIFPDLTEERRKELVKSAKLKLEEVKISLRRLRDDVWNDIQKKEKEGGMSEDEKFRLKGEMQKYIDESSKRLDEQFAKKEKEILL